MNPPSPASGPGSAALPEFRIDWGVHGLLRLLSSYDFRSVLDVGSGAGEHARLLRHLGKEVVTLDLHRDADVAGDLAAAPVDRTFDVVWCSHVLEHQRNVGIFLERLGDRLEDGGILALTVPLHPPERLVAGHLTAWNAGLLCYNLILAGFDCRDAILLATLDLSLIVRKRAARGADVGTAAGSGADLHPAAGGGADDDPLAALARFFPFPVRHGADAGVREWRWGGVDYRLPGGTAPFRLAGRFLPPGGIVVGADGVR